MKVRKTILWAFLALLLVVGIVYGGSQQTSSTAASTIVTNARYYLNEPSAVFWADAELLVWLNQGSVDIVARTKCLASVETVTLATDTIEYTLSANYLAVTDVVYVNTLSTWTGLIRSNPSSIAHGGAEGNPVYWYEAGSRLGMYPAMAAINAATGETARAYYVARPVAVTLGENVLVPAHYDHALTLYVAARAWYKDGQFAKAGRLMAEYYEELDRFRLDYNEQIRIPKEAVK